MSKDTLIVVSKVKKMIKEKEDLSTSQGAIEALSKLIEKEALKACQKAKEAKRKTLLDRDFMPD
jgi:histone H3/H4